MANYQILEASLEDLHVGAFLAHIVQRSQEVQSRNASTTNIHE